MVKQDLPPAVDVDHVVRIVSSYVQHHQVRPDQLVGLIVEVHRALALLERGTLPAPVRPQPAVPIRRSVQSEYVVCLELDFARERCAAICGYNTGSRWPHIGPVGICRRITR